MNENVLDDFVQEQSKVQRRSLIPLWMRIFLWFFLIGGILVLLGFVVGLFGYKFTLSIYGLTSDEPTSLFGMTILGIFLLKAVVAYALWFERDWAIDLGLVDAALGILFCVVLTVQSFQGLPITFRLELLVLVPYFIKLYRMREEWKHALKGSS